MVQPVIITENFARRPGGRGLFYLAAGPEDGPLVMLVHGWPELAISWQNQLLALGGLGFRVVAPDMPGYGRSWTSREVEDYRTENIVAEMRFLLGALGRDAAVWIGHDMGSPIVWSIANHHPGICRAVASLGVPYHTVELSLEHLVSTIDRSVYPEAVYPAGIWDYRYFYRDNFARATQVFDADPERTVRCLFVRGDPDCAREPAFIANVRRDGGWFGGADMAPDVPLDTEVLSEAEYHAFASSLKRNGFFGPDAYYMNFAANDAYSKTAVNEFRLDMPVLFIDLAHENTPECAHSGFADPMRRLCSDLTAVSIPSGHWVSQERPIDLNAAIVHWLATRAKVWPGLAEPAWQAL